MSTGNAGKSILVTTDWLQKHLADPQLRIFDCTGCVGLDFVNKGRENHYNKQHIPGAAYLDVGDPKGEMTDLSAPLPYTWPTKSQFEETMRRIGVDNICRVVLYSGPNPDLQINGMVWPTRAWWLMHHFGVDCAVLDGGWTKWMLEKRPVSNEMHVYPPVEFRALPGWRRGLAMKEDVLEAITNGSACVVDALSPESYRGEVDESYGIFGPAKVI